MLEEKFENITSLWSACYYNFYSDLSGLEIEIDRKTLEHLSLCIQNYQPLWVDVTSILKNEIFFSPDLRATKILSVYPSIPDKIVNLLLHIHDF
jgi:hypothetical protein